MFGCIDGEAFNVPVAIDDFEEVIAPETREPAFGEEVFSLLSKINEMLEFWVCRSGVCVVFQDFICQAR